MVHTPGRKPARRSNRRQFLLGQSALDAVAELADAIDPPDKTGGSTSARIKPASAFVLQFSRQAMACEFTVYLNAVQRSQSAAAALAALDLVDQLEDQLTVFREHSEVSQINRRAADAPVVVEQRLFGLLSQAKQLHQETSGAFDITTGPLTRAWGFFRRQGRLPSPAELQAALAVVGTQYLQLDHASQTVSFQRPGMEINLGGIGKGHALDRCAELMQAQGISDFVIHGGRSSVLARGNRLAEGGWQIEVRHPLRPALVLAKLTLRDRSVGTSGSAMQSFHVGHRRYGHILDPRTGQPAEGVMSATVMAPDAATADALGTAFYVLGPDAAQAYCDIHASVGALLIRPGKLAGDIVIDVINLEPDVVELFVT